ncbi:5-(carboxyamino)imidazole ribonucleotide synthase [Variovorax sp. RO1]|uniref:5-(carboxyamino)imidazole ribonucleotide synthase n=1 Tax=Variovorax sp. RO1 TaxID=2066034 RepID=UPI000C717700|nr:5-(carboxyamino)imidazole ribonucleotide synthase [Variovorax sp. RO1]PLC05030.1 5-(carboxyamino)imidazole ribonucleotide synthase [Variovorax sp. RO1]
MSGVTGHSGHAGDLPILPGATLGVLGGGQLGRMFAHAAQRMGYFTAVLDPDADSPAGRVSHHHIHTDYADVDGLARLAGLADAVTTEFENVPAPSLEHLAVARPVSPAASAIAIAQDRIAEKAHFTRCGVPCAPYAVIETAEQLAAVDEQLLPGILKTARLGYDGKGQQRVKTRAELVEAWQAAGCVPCVLEKMLALEFECSVILARGRDGQIVHFPPQRNLHRDGILAVTEVHPQNMPKTVAQGAVNSAKSIASGLDYVGVLCVEFFALADGSLVVNEMAPRPHNSGHYTMEACDVSQFELQVRTLAGLPLTAPRQHSPAVMLNLLGDLWFPDGEGDGIKPVAPRWSEVLAVPGTHLHLYGKLAPRRGRKMGHLTLTGATLESVRANASQAALLLGLPALA